MAISTTSSRAVRGPPVVTGYRPRDRVLVHATLAPVIAELYPDGEDWLGRRLDDVEHHRAIARLVTAAGQLAGVTIETPKSERRTKLSTLWVAQGKRNHGLGSALIDDRRHDWVCRGIKEASLTARSSVAASLAALLLPRGFELVTVEDDRYGEGRSEAVFQWRSTRDQEHQDERPRRLVWSDGRLLDRDSTD